jgi:ketosteroid isomerase-like protein
MSKFARFAAYAAAPESNDFSHIEPFFTEDAVCETRGGPPFDALSEGREAVFAHLKGPLDGMDRQFDARELALLQGPTEQVDTVLFHLSATYAKAGRPDLEISEEETAAFRGDEIYRMVNNFAPEATPSYMEQHQAALTASD